MKRHFRSAALATSALAVVVIAACRDGGVTAPPSGVNAITEWRGRIATACTPMTLAQLNALTDVVFSAGGPNANAVKSKIDQVDKAKKKGDRKKTDEAAFNANRLVFQKFKGPQPLAGTNAQVAQLISGIFCFAGIDITISDPANSNIIDPSATTQVVKSSDSTAGTKLPPGSITEPTVLEFTKVPNTYPLGGGPLNTRLDQYAGFYLIQAGSSSGAGPAVPVVVAICPDASVPASVRARLRLGHEKASGFEIAPAADASFLTCPAPSSLSFLPKALQKTIGKLLPKTLYAAIAKEEFRGGVGGTASEFSPFDPVDPELSFRGGVGGTAGEFIRADAPDSAAKAPTKAPAKKPSGGSPNVIAAPRQADLVACAAAEAPWSSPIATECRPGIVITTALGTVMRNVPVSWNVTLGGGTIAAEASGAQTCGAFGSNAANTTDANGRAGVCWNMGPTLGANELTATPSVGGDAPAGVTFVPATTTFTATSIKVTPVVATTCPDSVPYNGADQTPCTNTVTDAVHTLGLGSVPVVYGPTSPPRDAGTYTVDASYPGAAMYFPANAPQKTFLITKAVTTTVVSCPASVSFTGAALTPCTATVTGPGGLSQAVTPVNYTNNVNAGPATASATYGGSANYHPSTGTAGFDILPTTTWTATGPGTVTLLNNGLGGGMPSMSYSLPGTGGFSTQTWTFSTTAPSAGTFRQSYNYYGLHSWFQVRVFLKPFVISGAVKTYLPGAVAQGPENCCTPPSNGFSITGSTTFTVNAGDTYGWEIGGSHFDGSLILMGTMAVSSAPMYVNLGYIAGHNCWHNVNVSVVNPTTLRWTNSCAPAVSWLMHATANPSFYTSGPDYPYYGTPADVGFTLTFGAGGVINTITGPSGELYTRTP